ncbi:hypothetical protein TNCV_2372621 [Trichonephila clavipes]|nr:hypothetical protein TNCV_2372621 [Trichonephila clavipes]
MTSSRISCHIRILNIKSDQHDLGTEKDAGSSELRFASLEKDLSLGCQVRNLHKFWSSPDTFSVVIRPRSKAKLINKSNYTPVRDILSQMWLTSQQNFWSPTVKDNRRNDLVR